MRGYNVMQKVIKKLHKRKIDSFFKRQKINRNALVQIDRKPQSQFK